MAEKELEPFQNAIQILSYTLKEALDNLPCGIKKQVHEVRLRLDKPLTLCTASGTLFLSAKGTPLYSDSEQALTVCKKDIADSFLNVCGSSVYAHQNEIVNGFVTIRGGHRVGLCGTAVLNDGKITSVKDISSLNLRIARQIFGISQSLIEKISPISGGLLVAGMPQSGKTTLLRDMALRLSTGMDGRRLKTCVIDERGELSGTFSGVACNNLGLADILNGYPKGEGIMHAIRALSPEVIITDEVGTTSDVAAIEQGFNAGAYVMASIHAGSYNELMRRRQTRDLLATGAFSKLAVLKSRASPGEIDKIISL